MMQYALVNTDGSLSKIVDEYESTQLTPDILRSVASFDDAGKLAIGAYPVETPVQPTFDPITQSCIKDAGALVNGRWKYTWTVTALDAPTIAANQAAKKVQDITATRQQAQDIILAKYLLWVQANYANGIYPTADADVMKAAIASVITESNRLEDAITAGTPATPNWPTI